MRLPALRRAPAEYDERFVDTMASEYLERTPWTELRLEAVRSLVEPAAGERVLDLGCAAGSISHYLSGFGCETVGAGGQIEGSMLRGPNTRTARLRADLRSERQPERSLNGIGSAGPGRACGALLVP